MKHIYYAIAFIICVSMANAQEKDASVQYDFVERITEPLNRINKVNGYQWMNPISEEDIKKGQVPTGSYGVLSNELISVMPLCLNYSSSNGKYGIRYDGIIPILLEGIKALDSIRYVNEATISNVASDLNDAKNDINSLKSENDNLKSEIEQLQSDIEELRSMLLQSKSEISNLKSSNANVNSEAKLFQNSPNPFNKQCEIQYFIPTNSSNAKLIIMDLNGTLVKEISINSFGTNTATIPAGELNAGMYYYSLVVDNKETDTKKMLIMK